MSTRPTSNPPLCDSAASVDRLEKVLRVGCEFHETMPTAGPRAAAVPTILDEPRTPKLREAFFAQGAESFQTTISTVLGDQTVKYEGAQFDRRPSGIGIATWKSEIAGKTLSYAFRGMFTVNNEGKSTPGYGDGVFKVSELGWMGQELKTMIIEGKWYDNLRPSDVYVEIVHGDNVFRIDHVKQTVATDPNFILAVTNRMAQQALDWIDPTAIPTRLQLFTTKQHFSIKHWALNGTVETMQGEEYRSWSNEVGDAISTVRKTDTRYIEWLTTSGLFEIPDIDDFRFEGPLQHTPDETEWLSWKQRPVVRGEYFFKSKTECGWKNSRLYVPLWGYVARYDYPMLVRNQTTKEWITMYNQHSEQVITVKTWEEVYNSLLAYLDNKWEKNGGDITLCTALFASFLSVFVLEPRFKAWLMARANYRHLIKNQNAFVRPVKDIVLEDGYEFTSANLTMLATCSRQPDLPVVAASNSEIFIWRKGGLQKKTPGGIIQHIALLSPLVVVSRTNSKKTYVYNHEKDQSQDGFTDAGITAMAASPDGNLLAVAKATYLKLYKRNRGKLEQVQETVALVNKAKHIVVSNEDGLLGTKALVLAYTEAPGTLTGRRLEGMEYIPANEKKLRPLTSLECKDGTSVAAMAVTKTGSHWIYFATRPDINFHYVVGNTQDTQEEAENNRVNFLFHVKWSQRVRSVAFTQNDCAVIATDTGLFVLRRDRLTKKEKEEEQLKPEKDSDVKALSVQHMTTRHTPTEPGRIVTLRDNRSVVIHNKTGLDLGACNQT